MSRRESRVSGRQNDALFEFEAFKKKFLLANKAITKLNSTLSVRIEELNAQISSLYVENLRLRASEIALGAQLKREREKSRKVMAETEAATLSLTRHLGLLRQSFNIRTHSPPPSPPPPPRARRPTLDPQVSPIARVARPPTVPGIDEDNEDGTSTSDELPAPEKHSSPRRRPKTKPRLSASRLPLPARVASPPPLVPPVAEAATSALPPPAHHHLVSAQVDLRELTARKRPSRRQSGLLNVHLADPVPRVPSPAFGSPNRREVVLAEDEDEAAERDADDYESIPKREKKKWKGKERETDADEMRASKRPRPADDAVASGSRAAEGGALKLKDVTNSLAALPPDQASDPSTGDTDSRPSSSSPHESHLPTPRASSSPIPPPDAPDAESAAAALAGRERRTRKSVNYAEPKLNTKMRKPDPPPGSTPAPNKKRSSTNHSTAAYAPDGVDEDAAMFDAPIDSDPLVRAPSRPRSSSSSAGPAIPTAAVPASGAATSVKRKKSRPYVMPDEDESDGAQADAEYGGVRGALGGGWVNTEGRRRSMQGSAATRRTPVEDLRRVETDEGRRHSMAV